MIIEEIFGAPSPESLARAWCRRRGFFFLDSARPEDAGGRAFSFLGFDPFLTWQSRGDLILIESGKGREEMRAEPLENLRALLARYRSHAGAGLPFGGGAVGFFGYEFGARLEGVAAASPFEEGIPDARFGFYDGIVACDLVAGTTFAVANPVADETAAMILTRLRVAIRRAAEVAGPADQPQPFPHPEPREPIANLTPADFLRRVAQVREFIAAGEVYQVNLSQRFELPLPDQPYAIYQRLRAASPAPFGAYLDADACQILSSSPELFLRLDGRGRVLTRPIKGTRPRGRDAAEDRRHAAELVASEKDQAELLMIVDLERNDLGRVCRYGSIQVEERFRLETHPTVFHLVATISGQLAEGRDVFDCLRSLLPSGSITGAPKIRAMQIIAELEPCRRNVYTGAVGYLGFDGTCDLNVAIRTIVCHAGRARYHVGGGIVSDSDPAGEYQETLDKGRAMRAALRGEVLP